MLVLFLILFSALFYNNLLILVCTFISIVIYITILKSENGSYLYANLRFGFIIFLFLYTDLYPIFRLYLKNIFVVYEYLPVSDVVVEKGMLLSNLFIMIYIITSIIFTSIMGNRKRYSMEFYKSINDYLVNLKMMNFVWLIDIFALTVVVDYTINIYKSGVFGAILSGVSRLEVGKMIENQPIWQFMYFIVAYSCLVYTSAFNNLRFKHQKSLTNIIRVSLLSVFWVTDIMLGDRRLETYVLLFMFLYYIITKKKKMSFSKTIVVAILGLGFLLIGYLRTAGFSLGGAKVDILVNNSLGEFFVPINVFYYCLAYQKSFLYGSSYLSILPFIIPRSLWPEKPNSLAVDFANQFGGLMGYGFNPLAEGYLNFNILFIVLLPIILVILINAVERGGKKFIPLYFFAYTEIMNFNRGEFSTTLLEIVIMYFSFVLIKSEKRKKKEMEMDRIHVVPYCNNNSQ